MLFNAHDENFHLLESYKERNPYYKIFAGYIFNEHVPGYKNRIKQFLGLVKEVMRDLDRCIGTSKVITEGLNRAETINLMTFDYHLAQRKMVGEDRGESSDILIWMNSILLSIECKYLSNLEFKKDVQEVQSRIRILSAEHGTPALHILLIQKRKWDNSKKRQQPTSFYKSFIKYQECDPPCVVLFWEDLLDLIEDQDTRNYLLAQLNR